MNIEEEFRTEIFIADDGDPGLRWLTDEQVIERMAEEIGKLRAALEEKVLDVIEARNPGIDREEVRAHRMFRRAPVLAGSCPSKAPRKGYQCDQPLGHKGRHSNANGYIWGMGDNDG